MSTPPAVHEMSSAMSMVTGAQQRDVYDAFCGHRLSCTFSSSELPKRCAKSSTNLRSPTSSLLGTTSGPTSKSTLEGSIPKTPTSDTSAITLHPLIPVVNIQEHTVSLGAPPKLPTLDYFVRPVLPLQPAPTPAFASASTPAVSQSTAFTHASRVMPLTTGLSSETRLSLASLASVESVASIESHESFTSHNSMTSSVSGATDGTSSPTVSPASTASSYTIAACTDSVAPPNHSHRQDLNTTRARASSRVAVPRTSFGSVLDSQGVTSAPAEAGPAASCDACPRCDDVCALPSCVSCCRKRSQMQQHTASTLSRTFTMCQVRRHTTADDCWITNGKLVFNVSSLLASGKHPGGARSILRKAGTNCKEDFDFHSSSGQKLWMRCAIGKLVLCPRESKPSWWKSLTFW